MIHAINESNLTGAVNDMDTIRAKLQVQAAVLVDDLQVNGLGLLTIVFKADFIGLDLGFSKLAKVDILL